jgi:hypothetical protein
MTLATDGRATIGKPLLPGVPAYEVDYSRDGNWMTLDDLYPIPRTYDLAVPPGWRGCEAVEPSRGRGASASLVPGR